MPATSEAQKLDPERQQFVKCTHCDQRYVLTWDDKEWMSVKDWLRVSAQAIRKTHPRQPDN